MRILLVDNDKEYLRLLESWISTSYPEALIEIYDLTDMPPEPSATYSWHEYDLICLDYQLGVVDGLRWLELLKVVDNIPPIFFVTGQGDEAVAAKAIKLGAEEYLSKNTLTAELLSEAMQNSLGVVAIQSADTLLKELDITSLQDRIKDYTLIMEIGRGGRGASFGAESKSGDGVVIKMADVNLMGNLTGFIKECDQLSAMKHPNIASTSTAQLDEGFATSVMPYYERGNLQQRIQGGVRCVDAVRYTHHIAYGLAYLHEQGVVHGNLRPQNVLISNEDKALLTDIYTGGQLVTNNAYASPEQLLGKAPNNQSNIYSVGFILHEMLTGEEQCSVADLENTLHGYSQPMRNLMQRLLAIDPKERLPDAWALMDELLDVEWICAGF